MITKHGLMALCDHRRGTNATLRVFSGKTFMMNNVQRSELHSAVNKYSSNKV